MIETISIDKLSGKAVVVNKDDWTADAATKGADLVIDQRDPFIPKMTYEGHSTFPNTKFYGIKVGKTYALFA